MQIFVRQLEQLLAFADSDPAQVFDEAHARLPGGGAAGVAAARLRVAGSGTSLPLPAVSA